MTSCAVKSVQGLPTLVGHEGSLNAEDWADSVKTVLEGIEAGKWSKARALALGLASLCAESCC